MSPRCERLKSGLQVVLAPCEAESVAVGLFVRSGSRNERKAQAGISHFIEHMLFKGTAKRSALDITRAIEGRGGMFNAYTSEENTCFFAHIPDEYLAEAMDILVDMFKNAKLDAREFAKEKAVILEEIKMYADEPDSVAMENLQACLFPGHPLGRPVAGGEKSLEPMTPEDLRGWIKRRYTPRNTVLVVAGKFDAAKALEMAGRL
jgi:predicted Zn-dependent peptidase